METKQTPRFSIENINSMEPVDCPCGKTRRAFTDDVDRIASLHVVDITEDARTHYHKKMTEIYYVLEGTGQMELDGEFFDVGPGSTILIKTGCRHRAIGNMKILNVPVPAFDPDDEWFD
ncbi:MAG: cupin domain-containing protein [Planctomycetota bacterium]